MSKIPARRVYGDNGLSVMAFPCNQFGGQEPGTDEEIKQHVQEKYGITFDMMSKIPAVNGPNQIPVYEWMKSTEPGKNQAIKWNFTNFVTDTSQTSTQKLGKTRSSRFCSKNLLAKKLNQQ